MERRSDQFIRALTIVLPCLAAITIVWVVYFDPFPRRRDSWQQEFIQREAQYQYLAYKRLGEEVAGRHPGEKILLIKLTDLTDVDGTPLSVDAKQVEGFMKGLNGKATIVATERVDSGMDVVGSDEVSQELMKEMLTAKKMDAFIAKHKECTVVVSLAGLPQDYQLMKLWKEKDPNKRPALVLANAYIDDLKFAFKERFISASLTHRAIPFDPNKPIPENEEKAFDLRFLIVTPDNVDQIHRETPDFFKMNRKK